MRPDLFGIVMGALGGAVVGLERQRSGHASGPASHFAGIRTMTLLGGLAAVAGNLWMQGFEAIAVTIVAGAVAIIAIGYAAISRRDTDATTEVAGLIVVTSGVLSGLGFWQLASGITIVTAVLLVEKSRLHAIAENIPDVGLKAGFRFGLMALVILPLLPEGPYGPWGGVRPRELWVLVLFFSGISFMAYVVRSFLGPTQGFVWAGALGGVISSTNVTLSFSRLSRIEPASGTALALGVIAACTMLYYRVAAAVFVLNPALGREITPYLVLPAILGTGITWYGLRSIQSPRTPPHTTTNPLEFRSALQMAALFQAVLLVISIVREHFGSAGLVVSGAILGLTDADALIISMTQTDPASGQLPIAAVAITVGILSNTVLKLGVILAIGHAGFRKIAFAGLLLLGGVTALSLWF